MPNTTTRSTLQNPDLERTGGSVADAYGRDASFPPIERWRLSMARN
jgi:hypothetical protein